MGAPCTFLEWTSSRSPRAALAGIGLFWSPAHCLPETWPLSLPSLQMGKLRFRSPQVTCQGGLAGSLGSHSCLQAQDTFPPQIPQLALQYERGGTWASRRPQGTHLPACPRFLLHQGPGNAPRSLRRKCPRNVLPALWVPPTPHHSPPSALLSLCWGGREGLASRGFRRHWGETVFTGFLTSP